MKVSIKRNGSLGASGFGADVDGIVDATARLWERGMRLFLTGGGGFVGTWLLESFLHANRKMALSGRCTVLTRDAGVFLSKRPHLDGRSDLEILEGDVRSFSLPKGEFSHVIHGATPVGEPSMWERPLEMFDVVVTGTRRTFELAKQRGAKRFLLLSSGAIYGRQPPHLSRIVEEHPGGPDCLDPMNAYAEGKRVAELTAAAFAANGGPAAVVARGFAFLGPHLPLNRHFAVGNFIGDALRGGPINVRSDGTPERSYLYASEMATWLWTLLFRGKPGVPYNVGSEKAYPMREIARVVADVMGEFLPEGSPAVKVKLSPRGRRRAGHDRYIPSTARARRELKLRATISLRDAVRRTLAWHIANRNTP